MSADARTPGPTTDQNPDTAATARAEQIVASWMSGQRWYAAKGLDPALRVIDAVEETIQDDDADVRVLTWLVIDDAPAVPVLYQVPFTIRTAPVDALAHALIATDDDRWLYDGPHDPAYARWLLGTIADARSLDGTAVAGTPMHVDGQAFIEPGAVRTAKVLRGEQSNTSIICEVDGPAVPRVIVKVFRVLHHGENPDVTTQAALSAGGSLRVPKSVGALAGSWSDVGRSEGTAHGHLAFAQEFLPGLDDAWRVALAAATDGVEFTDQARALGAAVAEVHATLATALPTVEAGPDEVGSMLGSMRQRLDTAATEVPAIAEHADAVRALYAMTEELDWPRLQRIHGDLHLGQALLSPERGWILLDFEGEPLRPMPERSRPDVPLRDVAGMLRSFDYVAGALAHADEPVDSGSWAHDARQAFLDGYVAASGEDLRAARALLDAFEVDKAVYEAVYEARNRPDWVGIPVAAVGRLVDRSAPAA
ncbi:maltokinase N-terminal cap-like domain-containing protein [Curtobacterium sp. Leaf261]|uniref:maltokinase N-terminal cap-like domain-containing protein n=1 Tax=Curtobacterium sp. Leaf261 TaxID=1736311 RepID=UPI0006FA627D|nr:hypothetical protein [Curtobacterium sp. Leaf261]KQO62658.1 hypothetical protein ASF23_06725 [Curtobacterium sp. Leaf261]